MEFGRRHRGEIAWVVEHAQREGAGPLGPRILASFRTLHHQRPYLLAASVHVITAIVALLVYRADIEWLPWLAPRDPADDLKSLWEVHAVFVSLAFAGVAILIQIGSEALVTGRSLRAALFRLTAFQFTFAYSIFSLVQLGVVAIWFPTDSTLVLEYVISATAIAFVSAAYIRAAAAYRNPRQAEGLALRQLRDTLRRSQDAGWYELKANELVRRSLPDLFDDGLLDKAVDSMGLVQVEGVVSDINIVAIQRVVDDLPKLTNRPRSDSDRSATGIKLGPEIRIRRLVGNASGAGRPVFELRGANFGPSDMSEVEARLRRAVKWLNEA